MNKKTAILLCVIIILIGITIGIGIKNNDSPIITIGSNTEVSNSEKIDGDNNENETTITPLSEVTSYTDFFTINNIINKYYEYAVMANAEALLQQYNDEYKKENQINLNNIQNYFMTEHTSKTLYIKEMYVKGINDTMFFFISGQLHTYDISEEVIIPENDIKFLIVLDKKNNTYGISPIDSDGSLYLYANTYKMVEIAIKAQDYNLFEYSNINNERVTKYYTAYYKELLYSDTEAAYGMLSEQTKALYPDLESFVNNLSTIYSMFTTDFIGYEVTGEAGKRKYYSYNAKDKRITMQESSIMNFTVTIED